ncbi:vitamin B12 ABC transporter ATP-binding protein BtuD [Enterobacteriaceae bacterium 4M9]|nr:vitamin B12 ABC transporter ATP-binding protein BtuD [Enterobacteriaceae bacterium 4M9]
MTVLLRLEELALHGRVRPTSAQVQRGELLHLIGPNGAGKSSLLGLMAGLLSGEGRIFFDYKALADWQPTALAQRRALLQQQQTPPFAMPLWHFLSLHQLDGAREAALLAQAQAFGLEDKLNRLVSALSGGEWQRARLAAVLLQLGNHDCLNGKLLLLDEPMNSLDVAQQAALDRQLQALCFAGATVVMSSHDLNYSLRHAAKVWLIERGRLLAQGKPEDVLTPDRLTPVYDVPFRRLEVEGVKVLISSQ